MCKTTRCLVLRWGTGVVPGILAVQLVQGRLRGTCYDLETGEVRSTLPVPRPQSRYKLYGDGGFARWLSQRGTVCCTGRLSCTGGLCAVLTRDMVLRQREDVMCTIRWGKVAAYAILLCSVRY